MFKENFIKICNEKGLSPTKVCQEIGISKSNFSNWNDDSLPRKTTLLKIADKLNVDVSELTKNNPITTIPPKTIEHIETNHFVAYIDFLGIKNLIERDNLSLAELFSTVYKQIDTNISQINLIEKVHFKTKVFSDNLVLCFEIKNNEKKDILFNKLNYFFAFLSAFQYFTLKDYGLTTRGGVTMGNMYIDDTFLIGKAIDDVYYFENTVANYPRIIVNSNIVDKFKDVFPQINKIVKKDFDGEYFIDYLNLPSEADNLIIRKKIEELFTKSAINGNIKIPISQKLNWLNSYNNSYIEKKISLSTLIDKLTPEEVKKLLEYKDFLISQRDKK